MRKCDSPLTSSMSIRAKARALGVDHGQLIGEARRCGWDLRAATVDEIRELRRCSIRPRAKRIDRPSPPVAVLEEWGDGGVLTVVIEACDLELADAPRGMFEESTVTAIVKVPWHGMAEWMDVIDEASLAAIMREQLSKALSTAFKNACRAYMAGEKDPRTKE